MKIVDPLESPAREAAELELQNVKRQFDEATQDIIQLQNIDYPAGFRCDCWKGAMASRSCLPLAICTHELFSGTCQIICGARRWSDLDGIALGYKVQSHIVQPWQHAHDPAVVVGCAFADRIFLADRSTRELLMSFAVPGMLLFRPLQGLSFACTCLCSAAVLCISACRPPNACGTVM